MINNFSILNVYEKPKVDSKLSSQILYGEKFKVIYRKKNWLKIKTNYDNYYGFIKNTKFIIKSKPAFKVYSLKSKIYKKIDNKFKDTGKFLYFARCKKHCIRLFDEFS